MMVGPAILALLLVWLISRFRISASTKRPTKRTYFVAAATVCFLTPWNVFYVSAHQQESQLLNLSVAIACAVVAAYLSITFFSRREPSTNDG
jgi:Ca2+/H+ antiporter